MKNQNVFRMRTRRAAIILIVLAALCLLCLSGCAEQKAEQKEIPGSVKLRPKNILSQKSGTQKERRMKKWEENGINEI